MVEASERDDARPDPESERPDGTKRSTKRNHGMSLLKETALVVALALVIATLVRVFLVQAFLIPSGSMENTLQVSDRVLVSKLTTRFGEVERGDVIVFSDPDGWLGPQVDAGRDGITGTIQDALEFVGVLPNSAEGHLIKRVIGVGGDVVELLRRPGPGDGQRPRRSMSPPTCSRAMCRRPSCSRRSSPTVSCLSWVTTAPTPATRASTALFRNGSSPAARSPSSGRSIAGPAWAGRRRSRTFPTRDLGQRGVLSPVRNSRLGSGSMGQMTARVRSSTVPGAPGKPPSLRFEKTLLRQGHALVAACDEVGRGALGGPATVGVVLVDVSVQRLLPGLRDSKLLLPEARERLVPRIRRWAVAYAVGHASAAEVDALGILAALRLAGRRALGALPERPDVIILDGNHDYLTPPAQPGLFDLEPVLDDDAVPPVVTKIKADLTCASVAAASVLAKTERDRHMVRLARSYPGFGWEINKGYATPEHMAAIRRLGPCEQHRRSWRLPLRELAALEDAADHLDRPFDPEEAGMASLDTLLGDNGAVEAERQPA